MKKSEEDKEEVLTASPIMREEEQLAANTIKDSTIVSVSSAPSSAVMKRNVPHTEDDSSNHSDITRQLQAKEKVRG